MNTSGALAFDAVIQNTDFKRSIDEIQRRIVGLTSTAVRESDKMDATFKRLGSLAAGYFSFNALAQLPAQLVRVRGEFQSLELSLQTILSSKPKADALLREITDYAARTPYGLSDSAQAAKQLLAYGATAESIIPTLTKLGDLAAGVNKPLGDLVFLYGTTMTSGRLMTRDLDQFTQRGIPMIKELAKQFGVAESKVRDLAEEGKFGFAEVEKAINSLTGKGSMFGGLMEAQSKALTGLTARFSDAWKSMLNDIGRDNEGILAGSITTATAIVENYEPVLDVLKVIVATYGAYKTAIITTAVVQSAAVAAGNIQAWFQLAATIRSAKDAQIAFNLATSANPYAIAATLLVGLITAVALYSKELTVAERAENSLKEARENANRQASTELAKIELLRNSINNEKLSREERNKKLQELISLSPDYLRSLSLDSIKTDDGTRSINKYIEALKLKYEQQELDKKYTESFKRESDAKSGKNEIGIFEKLKFSAASAMGEGSFDYTKAAESANKQLSNKLVNDEVEYRAKLKETQKAIDEKRDAILKGETSGQGAIKKTVEWYDKEIEVLQKKAKTEAITRAEVKAFEKDIEVLQKQRRRLTGQLTKDEQKAQKDAEKTGPYGSISYWEKVAQKAQEVIDKTSGNNKARLAQQNAIKADAERRVEEIRRLLESPAGSAQYYEGIIEAAKKALTVTPVTNTAEIEKQKKIIIDAQLEAEEARKKIAVLSFSEELEEKKRQYELYQKWIEVYGKDSTGKQFSGLIQEGKTYVDYLTKQIADLEAKQKAGTITKPELQNLVELNGAKDEATGKKTQIEVFRENLFRAREEAKSLTDYLEILKRKQAELDPNDNSTDGITKRLTLSEETNQSLRERKQELAQFLTAVAGSEQQRYAITQRYADLRAEVERQYTNKKTQGYKRSIDNINKAEKEEFDALDRQATEASDVFKKLNEVIDAQGREAINIRIGRLKVTLTKLKETVGTESEIYKEVLKQLHDEERGLNADTLNTVKIFAGIAGELGDALSEVNGNLGDTGRLLSGIASQANLVTVAFDKNASEAQKIAAGVQGIVGIISILTTSANQRKKAEVEYYRAIIAQQQEYNIALNEQKGLKAELNENVFIQDFEGRLKDGVAKLNDANKQYKAALDKLSGGKAVSGQRDAIDWSKVGQAAGAGAAIGSIIPGIGTAIGAVVGGLAGAIIGLFGGKKKENQFTSLLQEYPELIKKGTDEWENLDIALAESLISSGLVDENTKLLLEDAIKWAQQIEEARKQIKEVISTLAGQLGNTLRDNLVTAFKDGTDAATAFGKSVSEILDNLLSQLIFNSVFKKSFDTLEKEMQASFAGGDNNWIDDFGRFFSQQEKLTSDYYAALYEAQKKAAEFGLELFPKNPKDEKDKTNTSLSGAIKGVSEETASVLAGQMNAIRINQAESLQLVRNQLFYMSEIAVNTRYLESIDRRLQDMSNADPLRAKGITG